MAVWQTNFASLIPAKAADPRAITGSISPRFRQTLELPPWEDDLKGLIHKDAM